MPCSHSSAAAASTGSGTLGLFGHHRAAGALGGMATSGQILLFLLFLWPQKDEDHVMVSRKGPTVPPMCRITHLLLRYKKYLCLGAISLVGLVEYGGAVDHVTCSGS